ncbi:MAG: hypothetical protein HY098_00710 [Nitrospinae bacterium]|nr:hypothetical protein [Nitrospinota bacterium]
MRKAAFWALGVLAFLAAIALSALLMLYWSGEGMGGDLDNLKRMARLSMFRHNLVKKLGADDATFLYQQTCYKRCHGEAAMITAVLSQAGWIQVVERMRLKENVYVSGREADVIINYLEEKYPKTKSRFSYETRKKVHVAVWRNDMGQNDIYADVIFATKEYLASIGADYLVNTYDLDHYLVFIVNFTVHEGEITLSNLDGQCTLQTPLGEMKTTPPWQLRFQTADKHHYEGVVRFDKNNPILARDVKWLKLVVKGVGGTGARLFSWDVPIAYPDEMKSTMANS